MIGMQMEHIDGSLSTMGGGESKKNAPAKKRRRQYACEECKERFTAKRELVTHRRTHQGRPTFHCVRCNKEFGTRQLLRKHTVWHTGERSHVCRQCGKAFFQKGHLTQHLMIHSGGRPHACTVCNKTFIFKFDLNRHMKIHATTKELGKADQHFGHQQQAPTWLDAAQNPPVLLDHLRVGNVPTGFATCFFCLHYQCALEALKKHVEKLEHHLIDKEAYAHKLKFKLAAAHNLLNVIIDHCANFDQLWTGHVQMIVGKLHNLSDLVK